MAATSLMELCGWPWSGSAVAWGAAGVLLLYVCAHYMVHGTNYPGPHLWPFVGSLPFIISSLENIHEAPVPYAARSKNFTFISKVLGVNQVVTANPENLEYVLKTNFQNYPKGCEFQSVLRDFLGHGIFCSDDEIWKEQRKVASHEFSTGSLRRLIFTTVSHETSARLLPTLRRAAERNEAIDVQDVLLRLGFDSICRIGFGVDPGCLTPELPFVPFFEAFDKATNASCIRALAPKFLWKTLRLLNCGWEAELAKSIKVVHDFADEVVQKRQMELAETKDCDGDSANPNQRHDLLSRFILAGRQEGGEQKYSPAFLRDVCTNFILAGRDTSAFGLTCFFWLLARHPRVEESILAEINSVISARNADERSKETFTFEELRSMHYLHAAISESLRLYPPVPLDIKTARESDTLPDGTFVPKGWRLSYSILAVGRMARVWGPDALEFNPERWLKDGDFQPESLFKFPVFNAGPRLCLGREMAYLQMKYSAAAILRCFHLKLVPGHPIKFRPSLTLAMTHGLLMTLHPRPAAAHS